MLRWAHFSRSTLQWNFLKEQTNTSAPHTRRNPVSLQMWSVVGMHLPAVFILHHLVSALKAATVCFLLDLWVPVHRGDRRGPTGSFTLPIKELTAGECFWKHTKPGLSLSLETFSETIITHRARLLPLRLAVRLWRSLEKQVKPQCGRAHSCTHAEREVQQFLPFPQFFSPPVCFCTELWDAIIFFFLSCQFVCRDLHQVFDPVPSHWQTGRIRPARRSC